MIAFQYMMKQKYWYNGENQEKNNTASEQFRDQHNALVSIQQNYIDIMQKIDDEMGN
jgi:hypothetical protein